MDQFSGLHAALTHKIIGVFYAVQNELGIGFVESVYQSAMVLALRQAGLEVAQQAAISVEFRGEMIGTFRADLIVNNLVILELKVAEQVTPQHESQLVNYLRATRVEVGIVLAFGENARHKRVYLANRRKPNIRYNAESPL